MQFSVILSKLGDSSTEGGSSDPKSRASECCSPFFLGGANNVTIEPTNKLYLSKSALPCILSPIWSLLKVEC